MSTPAEELRAAAQKIRDIAAKTSHRGEWIADGTEVYTAFDRLWIAETLDPDTDDQGDGNAAHVALWHPGTAVLVAQVLETAADITATFYPGVHEQLFEQELAIARAVNGEPS